MNLFAGLYGYECVMLICGFVLFVFALAAVTVMIVQRRSFKALTVLFLIAIVLMGFPGIAAVKFNNGVLEIDTLREQPAGSLTPQQQQQYAKTLTDVEQRSAGQPALQAKIADGYRVLGDVNRAYALAQSVLAQNPKPATRQLLVPVLTAKLNQVAQAGAPAATPAVEPAKQHEIATIAGQLQTTAGALPATSHVALARAYVALGQPQRAAANVTAARRLDPHIAINPALLQATRHAQATPAH